MEDRQSRPLSLQGPQLVLSGAWGRSLLRLTVEDNAGSLRLTKNLSQTYKFWSPGENTRQRVRS